MYEIFRKTGAIRYYATLGFASLVSLAVKGLQQHAVEVRELVVDLEYTGHESRIKRLILSVIPHLGINFVSIGKKSPAHGAAYYTYVKELKADATVINQEILDIIKDAPESLHQE